MTGQVISPSAAMTTIADVTDAIHTTAKKQCRVKNSLSDVGRIACGAGPM